MKQWTKQVLKAQTREEGAMMRSLRQAYREAYRDVTASVERLVAREAINAGNILRLKQQRRLKAAILEVLTKLETGSVKSVEDYLRTAYDTGAMGAMYSMQRQGVPLLLPVDPRKVTKALESGALLKTTLSQRIHRHVDVMAETIQKELTRGIVQGAKWADIARNIEARSNVGLRHAYTIARTEGHRVAEEARYDTMKEAETYGVKMFKRWDAALDDRTRIHHIMLDGQTVPIDQPFVVDGLKAMYPGGFGIPSEDINCRCTCEEVAQWEMDEDMARTKWDGRDGRLVKVKSSTFEAFKRNYHKNLPQDHGSAHSATL